MDASIVADSVGPGAGFPELEDAQSAALAMISRGVHLGARGRKVREAWLDRQTVEAEYPGTIGPLIAAGLVEPWDDCPFGPAVALTPLAAFRLAMTTAERWHIDRAEIEVFDGPDKRPKRVKVRTATEVCYETDADLSLPLWVIKPGLDHEPAHAFHVPLPFPERVIDPAPGPELLIDEVTEEPVLLFAGGVAGKGVPVVKGRGNKAKRDGRKMPKSAKTAKGDLAGGLAGKR